MGWDIASLGHEKPMYKFYKQSSNLIKAVVFED